MTLRLTGLMARTGSEISKEVMLDEESYPLPREDEVDHPYFKQVLIIYWVERDREFP